MTALSPFSRQDGLRYGLLGLPLAFCALPLYVFMPHFYATEWGMSLTALGIVLLCMRMLDALLDPWIGRWCDHLARQGSAVVWRTIAWAALVLSLAFVAVFNPQVDRTMTLWWAVLALAFTYLSYSLITVAHQSWGAALGGDAPVRSAIVAWREGLGLLGVVLAAAVSALWGAQALGLVMALALLLAVFALRFAPLAPQLPPDAKPLAHMHLLHPWHDRNFVRLVAVFTFNGIASAIPATLVLFFIEDRLQVSASQQGVYLGLYFLCAAVSMPLWLRLVARWGLARSWLAGMGASIAAFAMAGAVGAGDALLFGLVCAASGMALGSDLAIPAAMLAEVADRNRSDTKHAAKAAHGLYFGWWNFVAKLNLALAAGLTLPLLAWLGYAPGARDAASLQTLTAVYCVLPCALKAAAAAALFLFFIRTPGDIRHAT